MKSWRLTHLGINKLFCLWLPLERQCCGKFSVSFFSFLSVMSQKYGAVSRKVKREHTVISIEHLRQSKEWEKVNQCRFYVFFLSLCGISLILTSTKIFVHAGWARSHFTHITRVLSLSVAGRLKIWVSLVFE